MVVECIVFEYKNMSQLTQAASLHSSLNTLKPVTSPTMHNTQQFEDRWHALL